MKLRWSRFALQDIKNLHDTIAEDNPQAARKMVSRIKEAGQHLKVHPHLGKPGRVPETRELILAGTPYIIVYMVATSQLQIAAVLHSAMRWPEHFSV